MEPLSDRITIYKNLKAIKDCYVLSIGCQYFFSQPKNRTTYFRYYLFGLSHASWHYDRDTLQWKSLLTFAGKFFPDPFDHELMLAIEMGKDLNYDLNETEYDKVDSLYWAITKAIEYNRPVWSYYLFLGKIQALLNGAKITKDRFYQYMSLFPKNVLIEHRSTLEFAFNFFDERGTHLTIFENGAVKLEEVGPPLYPEIKY